MTICLEIEESLVKLASQVSGLPTGKEAVEAVLRLLTSNRAQQWSEDQPQTLPIDFREMSEQSSTPGDLTVVTTLTDWSKEPFIGIWKDREEMEDSVAWVRQLRGHGLPKSEDLDSSGVIVRRRRNYYDHEDTKMTDLESKSHGEQVKQTYLARVNQLFTNIPEWLKDYPDLQLERGEVVIGEELTDYYTAPVLVIKTPTQQLAKIEPQGACIMEAEGRIDVYGLFGVEYIIYLVNGGPYLRGQQMFKDVSDDGWYWVENNLKNQAHTMNKGTFINLFREATDYDG
jgi:hypothetical protein